MIRSLADPTTPPEEPSPPLRDVDLGRDGPSTSQIIARLFPPPTQGCLFLARFLDRAAREPSQLPGEGKDAVYICTQSIATLAKELKLSGDTTQKYVVLYMALGLLAKHTFMGQLAFVLSTGIYQPPENLEANLDYLIQKNTTRPKLRAMAVEVRARCRIYGLTQQDVISSLEQIEAVLHTEKGTSRRTFEQRMAQARYIASVLKVALTSYLSAESTPGDGTRGRNLPRTGLFIGDAQQQENQESTQWLHARRQGKEHPSQNLLGEERRVDSPRHPQDEESTQGNQLGRFAFAGASSRLPDSLSQVDSLHMSRKGESTQDGHPGRFGEKHRSTNLPNPPSQVDSIHDERERESTQDGHLGRFGEKHRSTNLPNPPSQVDSIHGEHEHESTQDGTLGRFAQSDAPSRLPQTTGRVDSGEGNLPARHAESTQVGHSGRRDNDHLRSNLPKHLVESTQVGHLGRREDDHIGSNLPDPSHQVDSGGASRNVNAININNYITLTLRDEPRQVAEFLAEQLEGDRRVYPKYQKLFHVQDGQARSPHVLAAAYICTLVRLHRDGWNLNHPGGFFTKRCREYDAGVPEEVEGWITDYGQLSLVALMQTLVSQRQPGRAPVHTTPVQQPAPGKPAPKPLLPPLALSPKITVEQARVVMSKQEATSLCEQVARDHRTTLFRTMRLRQGKKEHPRYAVLVDLSLPGGPPHQTVVYSRAEWQGRLDTMKTWRDLIYPTPNEPPGADRGRPTPGKETTR